MNVLTLQTLTMKNFKGIKDFTFSPNGKNAGIHSDNAKGKTTIIDASSWLLFGKDSEGKADAQFKPVYITGLKSGQEIHKLETEVTGVYEFNGKTVTLKKLLYENYTKKRGESQKEFTGNKYKFWIDDIPEPKGKFTDKVADIIDINVFKLITNPYEFNNLHWQKRRDILLEICGDIPDSEVANNLFPAVKDKDKYAILIGIINDCGIEDHKKKVKAKKSEINKELEQIPIRITENLEASKDVEKPEQKEKDKLEKKLDGFQKELKSLQSNERVSEKQIKLNKVIADIQLAESKVAKDQNEAKKPLQEEIYALDADRRKCVNKINNFEDLITQDEKRNKTNSDARDQIRKRWHEENDKKPKPDNNCPTCGHELPEEDIEEAITTFNRLKSERIETITTEGRGLKKTFDQREKDITANKLSIDTLNKSIIAFDNDIESKNDELEKYIPAAADTEKLEKEKAVLESEIKALKNGSKVHENTANRHIVEVNDMIETWNTSNAEYKAAEKSRTRVIELEDQEKKLSKEFEKLESELFLLEKFIIAKVDMLEGQINEKFKMARFKLFDVQINGGVSETCEVIYKGVPFSRGLNTGAQIQVGIDIINTLSEYYGFSATIFCDNRESVTSLPETDAQVISFFVDKKCKKLTVK